MCTKSTLMLSVEVTLETRLYIASAITLYSEITIRHNITTSMVYRTLELNITSAKDLKDVNLFSKMNVYAVVSISGDPLNKQKSKTPVDRDGGKNPIWNFPIKFTINQTLAHQNRLTLEIKLRCERTLAVDRDIGDVYIPIKDLLDQPGDGNTFNHVSYQVRKPSGRPKGSLNLSYKFGENFAASAPPLKADPVMAYPPPAPGSSSAPYAAAAYPAGVYPPPLPPQYAGGYGYPPPPQQYGGYPPPPQPGYGYPPQYPGYGYPQVQRPTKNNFGMGLGAGLLGGALGGLLIGDMMSDASAYDAGYDTGFGF